MSIKEILEELVKKVYAGKEVESVSVTKAHQAIISAIFKKMPKENYDTKIAPIELNNEEASAYLQGFNSALTEMRERVKEV